MKQEIQPNDLDLIQTIILIAGNDGTGKSTLFSYINQTLRKERPEFFCIQRSFKNCYQPFMPLLMELKHLDLITFNYAFEDERLNFQKSSSFTFKYLAENNVEAEKTVKVRWFILDLEPEKIRKRLHSRKVVDIYDSKKAVEYYSFIYREFAWYYGIPLIYADIPTTQIVQKIMHLIESPFHQSISSLGLQSVNLDFINKRNIESEISIFLEKSTEHFLNVFELVKNDINASKMSEFYFSCPAFVQLFHCTSDSKKEQAKKFCVKLCARWLVKNGIIQLEQNKVAIAYPSFKSAQNSQSFTLDNFSSQIPYFKIYEEGESKILFTIHSFYPQVQQYFKGKAIILLKSTIYSHTKQHTGQIANLSKIRAMGNILFLEMMRRNNLNHAYLCIKIESQCGIILSQLVQTSQLQIVFKKQCLGTDKHSYHGMNTIPQIVDQANCYTSGVYIRFDWRNPNHFMTKHPNLVLNLDPYYYVVQKFFGKQQFFKLFLTSELIKPMGDKCITQDFLNKYAPTSQIKKNTLKVYSTFLYYSRKVGLQILDGCLMFDAKGQTVWSEINPDCMRVKSIKDKEDYDKDIWRYGGSSKKEDIVEKWSLFNRLFSSWFLKNRFHQQDLYQIPQLCYPYHQTCRNILQSNTSLSSEYQSVYRELSSPRWDKRLIGTIDISQGQPILVKSSKITESHSEGSLYKAYNYISLLQQIVLVDIDAAIDGDGSGIKNNRKLIKQLVDKDRTKILAVGGGIRTQTVLDEYLNHIKSKKVILSTNLQLIKLMKPEDISERVIVELSINENKEVLIKGRSQNTYVKVVDKIIQLSDLGVKTISITFNHRQGHLTGIPKKLLIEVISQIPQSIENIIIAGGISSIEDLNFIWGFKRCIPQLGSAIWKQKISIADIYPQMVKFNNEGLVVAIVTDQHQNVLGQVYLNKEALRLTCETRKFHRYSREHKKVMKKGETSSNVFNVIKIKLDCDNDSIIVQVKPESKKETIFCHKNQYSCFDKHIRKNDINILQSHILDRKETGSGYTKKMTENEGLAAMKIVEQVQELHISDHNKVHQAADLMAHLMMYFNSHNISMGQILGELERRSFDTIKIQKPQLSKIQDQTKSLVPTQEEIKVVGIIGGKHFDRIDKLTQGMIGIRIVRASNRSAKIDFEIVNQELYNKAFKNSKIKIVGIKSKDMTTIVAKSLLSYCVNYSIMMENYPTVCKEIIKIPTPGIILALLGRKNECIDPQTWTSKSKGIIVCEYPFSVNKYFKSLNIDESCYTLIRVSGGTQSYLASQNFRADLCDAIIESGKTVEDNDLKIIATLESVINAGFYEAL